MQKYIHYKTKIVVCFVATTRGKIHHLCKTKFNRIQYKRPQVPRLSYHYYRDQINKKCLHVPIIQFYIINCSIKYFTKRNGWNISTSTQAHFTFHRTHHIHIDTCTIKHKKKFCASLLYDPEYIFWTKTVTIYTTTTHTHTSHVIVNFYMQTFPHHPESIQKNIPLSCINLPLGWIRIKSIQTQILTSYGRMHVGTAISPEK